MALTGYHPPCILHFTRFGMNLDPYFLPSWPSFLFQVCTMVWMFICRVQSLTVSQEMSGLLKQVLCDPSGSKLGALLEQNKQLLSSPASSPSDPTLQSNIQELNGYEVLYYSAVCTCKTPV